MNKAKTGVVETVQYTYGGAGNQWTTIDGVRYATWWDIRTRDWCEGDRVQFTSTSAPLWDGMGTVLQARDITRVVKELT